MIKTSATIKDYRIKKDSDFQAFWRKVIGMVGGDGLVYIQVTKAKRKSRTNSQNRYYWGVVLPHLNAALREYGHDLKNDELHLFLKEKFLERKKITVMGEDRDIDPSTKDLSTVDFQIYIDAVCRWAGQMLDIVIPLPESKTSYV